jgi:glutathione S-transferase
MSKEVTLYSYWRSSSAWRVRVALETKGIKYQYKAVPLLKNEQKSDEYSKLNPMQQVPCLVVSEEGKADVVINQSLAIIEFIDSQFEGPSLYPTGTHTEKMQVVTRQSCSIPLTTSPRSLTALPFMSIDAADRAFAVEVALDVAAGIQPIQNLVVLQNIEEIAGAEQKTAWGTWLDATVTFLHKYLY